VAILTVRTYPDEVLHENCEEVTAITPEIEQLIDDMFETMFKNKGVGLAAPQVGVLKNIIIVMLIRVFINKPQFVILSIQEIR